MAERVQAADFRASANEATRAFRLAAAAARLAGILRGDAPPNEAEFSALAACVAAPAGEAAGGPQAQELAELVERARTLLSGR